MSNISSIYVPWEGPDGANILAIGEAPGESEEALKQPFIGESGSLFMNSLGRAGVSRDEIKLVNRSHYRPLGNKFEYLINTPQLAEGDREIREYIRIHEPKVILALGAQALEFTTGKRGIHAWRGSILSTPEGTKVIPTFHPAAVLRDRTLLPIFDGDIYRAVADSKFSDLRLPERKYVIDPRGIELEQYTQLLCDAPIISCDIESVKESIHILCVGFAPQPDLGICIVNREDSITQNAIRRILSSPAKKVFHFGTFDTEMLHLNGHDTHNFYWDTLVAQHVLNSELPRGLDFLTSIYTREPYYKNSGRAEIPNDQKSWGTKVDKDKLWIYNCKDCCVTLEIALQQMEELKDVNDIRLFKHEMSLIPVGQSMSRAGIPLDAERRELFENALYFRWAKLQNILEILCGRDVNVKSPKLKDLLYGDFKLPVKRKRPDAKNPSGAITTDEDAIVSLITYCTGYIEELKRESSINEWRKKLLVLKTILEIRGLRTALSNYIKNKISGDGRSRSTYKFSNTETGRAACEHYVDGTGNNAQTYSRGYVEIEEEAIAYMADEKLKKQLEVLKSVDLSEDKLDNLEAEAA